MPQDGGFDVCEHGSCLIEQPPQPPRSKENRSVTFASDFVQEAPLVPQDISMPQPMMQPILQPILQPPQPPYDPMYDQPYYGPMQ